MKMTDQIKKCNNVNDFRVLAKKRLPFPVFHYIDGAADDEITLLRNTESYNDCDLVPNVLRGVEDIDLSISLMGKKLSLPFFLSPTALQRLFHHEGEMAVGKAAEDFNTFFGISSLSTVSAEEISKLAGPKIFQLYFHKDRGLTKSMIQKCKEKKFDALALTVDTITGGNRERDLKTGFSIPFKLSLNGIFQFAVKPMWALNYLTHEKFSLPQLDDHVDMSDGPISIGRYFTEMLDPCLNWDDVAKMVEYWDGQFCLKGVMSVEDAKKAVDIGCTGIVISNHGGRQLDGSRSPFDQLSEIVDAVGDDIDVIMDSGIQRGTHVLKALSIGAKAVGGGRFYLFALAAVGQHGVERALELMKLEIERDMRLMGVCSISELNRENLRFR